MSTMRDRNIRTSEARIWETLVVAILAAIGTSLALQGWKSRIPSIPFLDVLTTIDEADQLVENGHVPQKGVLTSFASFAPPGLAWLMAPGVLLLKDPRLFEYIGMVGISWISSHRYFDNRFVRSIFRNHGVIPQSLPKAGSKVSFW